MDILTQSLLGGVLVQSVAKKEETNIWGQSKNRIMLSRVFTLTLITSDRTSLTR